MLIASPVISPGPLHDISTAGDPVSVCQQNFESLTRDLYKHSPTKQSGTATALIGPPTSGDRVLDELWKDAWCATWRCTVAGTPGTWRQETPAVREGEPASGTIPTGYLILDASSRYQPKVHSGSYVWRAAGSLTAAATLDFGSINAAASADLTVAVPGAAVGNAVSLGLPAAPTAGIVFQAFVSAADTVTVRATNITGAPVDPTSASYRATVHQTV